MQILSLKNGPSICKEQRICKGQYQTNYQYDVGVKIKRHFIDAHRPVNLRKTILRHNLLSYLQGMFTLMVVVCFVNNFSSVNRND